MTAPVEPGTILAGKYRVDRVLGVGGMGVVVAAHHMQLDEKVALKFLLPEALGNQEAVARFAQEARAAVKIKSEHVARVSDVGTLENGAPYIVMEYLDGEDLSAWIENRGPLPVEQAAEFLLQACEAIAEAHGLGIVHRDLKPANLFCIRRADGQLSVKVLDFGISKFGGIGAGSGPDLGMTKTSAVMGSPLYMSPEQMESSRNVDARTDIWALGAILYELVTGKPPFLAETMPELIIKIMGSPSLPLANFRPDAPPGLEAMIQRCMEKDRTKRYPNVAELAHALMPFAPRRARSSVERISGVIQAAGLSASALALPPSSEGAARGAALPAGGTAAGTAASWVASQNESGGGKRRGLLIGGAFAAVLVAAGAFIGMRGSASPVPPASADVPATAPRPAAQPEPAIPTPVVTAPAEHEPPPAAVPSAAPVKAEPTPIAVHLQGRGPKPTKDPTVTFAAPAALPAPPAATPAVVAPAPQPKPNVAPAPATPPSILVGGRM
jgi:serine/threonine-protein kinase